ncbi:MAG: hypothetical protein U0165_16575 [Polyangiaceae bacterium]
MTPDPAANESNESNESKATKATNEVNARPVALLAKVAKLSPFAGVTCLALLVISLVTQLESWEATPFVLLFYGALFSAIASAVSLIELKRRRETIALPESHGTARTLLWIVVSIGALWFWAPGLMVPIVGRVIRLVSTLRF